MTSAETLFPIRSHPQVPDFKLPFLEGKEGGGHAATYSEVLANVFILATLRPQAVRIAEPSQG